MIEEAQEHNELLQELCKTDKEYELCLHTFFYRKRQISDFLGKNLTWLKFVKSIQTSPNWIFRNQIHHWDLEQSLFREMGLFILMNTTSLVWQLWLSYTVIDRIRLIKSAKRFLLNLLAEFTNLNNEFK